MCGLVTFMVDTVGRLMSKVVFNLSDNQTGLVTTGLFCCGRGNG